MYGILIFLIPFQVLHQGQQTVFLISQKACCFPGILWSELISTGNTAIKQNEDRSLSMLVSYVILLLVTQRRLFYRK